MSLLKTCIAYPILTIIWQSWQTTKATKSPKTALQCRAYYAGQAIWQHFGMELVTLRTAETVDLGNLLYMK